MKNLLLLLLLIASSCNYKENKAASISASANSAERFSQVKALFQAKCAECHGAGTSLPFASFSNESQFLNVNTNFGTLVVPGSSGSSRIYLAANSNSMPPNSPLTSDEKTLIAAWIDGMNGTSNGGGDTSPPVNNPIPTPTTPTPTYNAQCSTEESCFESARIIMDTNNKCLQCHQTGGSATGWASLIQSSLFRTKNYKRFVQYQVASGALIVPGSPDTSPLYAKLNGTSSTMFTSAQRNMPLGAAPLSSDEINVIKKWISYIDVARLDENEAVIISAPADPNAASSSASEVRIASKTFVRSMFLELFGPGAEGALNSYVQNPGSGYVSTFGGACDPLNRSLDRCVYETYNISFTSTKFIFPKTNATRAANLVNATRVITGNCTNLMYARNLIRSTSDVVTTCATNANPPTLDEVKIAYKYFYEENPSDTIAQAIFNEVTSVDGSNAAKYPGIQSWGYLFLILVNSMSWQLY